MKKSKNIYHKKPKSLSGIFASSMIMFAILFIITTCVFLAWFVYAADSNAFRPANYMEQKVKAVEEIIATVGNPLEIKAYVPDECKYGVFLKEGILIDGNVSINQAEKLKSEVIYGSRMGLNRMYYLKIERDDGYCIIQYPLCLQFENNTLRKLFPNVEIFIMILFCVLIIMELMLYSKQYQKKMRRELNILKEATEQIKEQNLDFTIRPTRITDFNEVLETLGDLKEALSMSLKTQWKNENEKKKQIGALAHDIKTPITIIKGGAELLAEMELTDEAAGLNQSILEETGQMQQYINQLIELNRADQISTEQQKEWIDVQEFLSCLNFEYQAMCKRKNIAFQMLQEQGHEEKILPDYISVNPQSLKRALGNIMVNAVFYCPEEKTIRLSVGKRENQIRFVVEDSGRGFSKEELQKATQEFYQGDESRTDRSHYGMGLYIASTLIQSQGGEIRLSNSSQFRGARVEILLGA